MDGADDLSDSPARRRPIPRMGARARIAVGIALLLLVALIALWLVRKPIAQHLIDGELARRGVAARYDLTDLGLGSQRLTNVVVGDPAHPDLVADWIETETSVGLSGPSLSGIRIGRARLRGRLVDGRVSLGELDKLTASTSSPGAPFALPKLHVAIADGRMRLETPYGVAGIALTGEGRLDDGFAGRAAIDAPTLAIGDCTVRGAHITTSIRTRRGAPSFTGLAGAALMPCGAPNTVLVQGPGAAFDVTLTPGLTGWRGTLTDAGAAVTNLAPGQGADKIYATVRFAGDANRTAGTIAGTGGFMRWAYSRPLATARDAFYDGTFAIGRAGTEATLNAAVNHVTLDPALRRSILDSGTAGIGTPIAPLAAAAARAAARAATDFALTTTLAVRQVDGRLALHVDRAALASASGASIVASGGSGLTIAGGVSGSTEVAVRGEGLPTGTLALNKPTANGAVSGTARFAPYAAGSASLTLDGVRFAATPRGNTRFAGRIELSGPLGDGRVESLTLPIDGLWDGRGRLAVNTDCKPIAFRRLAVAGLTLDPARLTLCPTGPALVTLDRGSIGGGARLAATTLAGKLGSTPLTLAATGADLSLGNAGFTVRGVQTRLGTIDRTTRLDFASVTGRVDGGAVTGSFAGGAGQIANVPLLIGDAVGDWTLRGGGLALTGTLGVSDAQVASPRFKPMIARDVALRLANGTIETTGTLHEPTTGTKVADLRIVHALAAGTGSADLIVPSLVFAKGFQPDLLTPLTYGVIADVAGTITGSGRIDWSPAGVTSTGTFATAGTDVAAAFGPVTGIAGTIRFTDLLALQSAPGQVATVKTINPGIVVENGRIVFQTLPNTQVRVESGVWPFAGGTLTLEPTLLDFAESRERRMTFRVDGAAADQFLQQFDFKNLNATGVFDGTMPMVFDSTGGRIESGRLAVRSGGGSLAYVGDLSQKDLGFWSNLAFGALKSLRYRSLAVVMNGPLAGEMVTEVKFAGVSQGEGAKSNFLIRRLQKLPFVFNIRIKAPFRGLLDSAQSFYDPSRLIQRNLPTLIDAQKQGAAAPAPTPVQPPASEIVP